MAQHFTEKGFIEVNRTRLSITSTPSKCHDSKVTSRTTEYVSLMPRTVEVSGIPEGISEDYLRMYFESEKRSGGGEVVHLQYSETQGTATITFRNHTGTVTSHLSTMRNPRLPHFFCYLLHARL